MPFKRHMEDEVKEYLASDPEHSNVLLLGGARQVGKSTLVEYVTKDLRAISVNLYERPTVARQIDSAQSFEELERILKRELGFTHSLGTALVIDEAQEARRLGRWIHFFKEKWIHQKVIVLGSILSNLFEEGVAYPVGRVEELILRPFSFKEYLLAAGRAGLVELMDTASVENPLNESDIDSFVAPYISYLRTGGMPAVLIGHIAGREDAREQIDALLGQYSADVERHMGSAFKSMFLTAMKRIADITCHPIKMSQIISTDSPSYKKLPELLEIQDKWHLALKVPSETKNPESAGKMASKRYLFDVGFTNFFINHSMPVEWSGRSQGGNLTFPKLQENFVCNEIIARMRSSALSLNYYKETRNSREIDFIVPVGKTIIPVEVKSSTGISRNSLLPMLAFLEQRGLTAGVLIYNGPMKQITVSGRRILAMPAFMAGEIQRLFGG